MDDTLQISPSLQTDNTSATMSLSDALVQLLSLKDNIINESRIPNIAQLQHQVLKLLQRVSPLLIAAEVKQIGTLSHSLLKLFKETTQIIESRKLLHQNASIAPPPISIAPSMTLDQYRDQMLLSTVKPVPRSLAIQQPANVPPQPIATTPDPIYKNRKNENLVDHLSDSDADNDFKDEGSQPSAQTSVSLNSNLLLAIDIALSNKGDGSSDGNPLSAGTDKREETERRISVSEQTDRSEVQQGILT
jgi:hypothetical protein